LQNLAEWTTSKENSQVQMEGPTTKKQGVPHSQVSL